MALFGFLKKKDGDVPPDIGSEATTKASDSGIDAPFDPGESAPMVEEDADDPEVKKGEISLSGKSDPMIKLKVERMDARLESINDLIKGFSERFSAISQQIGELRGMSLSNEKAISKIDAESAKAIDIVEAVKPEKIRFDYERIGQRVEELSAKIESNKEYQDNVVEQMKDLKRKAESFIGVEGLIHLQADVKKDLLNIQQINAKAEMHADKAEQLFIEIERISHENNQVLETLGNFERNYASLKKDFEKIKIDFSNIATKNDLTELKKRMESKVSLVDNAVSYTEKVRDDNEKLLRLVESNVAMIKKNEQDIKNIGLVIGDDKIDKVADYDERLSSLLEIVDSLAKQIVTIKKKVGISSEKIKIAPVESKEKEEVTKNVELPSKVVPEVANEKTITQIEPSKLPESIESPKDIVDSESAKLDADDELLNNKLKDLLSDSQDESSKIMDQQISEIKPVKEEENELPELPKKKKKAVRKKVVTSVPKFESDISLTSQTEPVSVSDEEIVVSPRSNHLIQNKEVKPRNSFVSHLKNAIPLLRSSTLKESSNSYLETPKQELKVVKDKQIITRLQNLISESFDMIDKEDMNALKVRYESMKKLYDSLSVKDPEIESHIMNFYNTVYNKFYSN